MSWVIGVESLTRAFPEGCVVAIGVFDGVHRGHQALIQKAVQHARAQGLPAVALTFDPHPLQVLSPAHAPPLLCSLRHRLERLRGFGIDLTVVQPFTEAFARLSAGDFVETVLVQGLGARVVVVGEDFQFGAGRSGDVAFLRQDGRFEVLAIAPVVDEKGERLSSTRVRQWVQSGVLDCVHQALGEPFHWEGVVMRGDQRGRTLGYPTANLAPVVNQVCPAPGVYACRATVAGEPYPAAVSVGTPPMFPNARAIVEAYLIGFPDQPLYGRLLTLEFLAKLREQGAFESLEALQQQMAQDVARTEAIYRDFFAPAPSQNSRNPLDGGEPLGVHS
ncbi:MAG: riboflavin biosynthesis protein [Fimbriimonadales bacterium]|nr:MAG: riboflavin biosynthesis protein [Fimbriimonadales bacterium]